MDETDAGEHQVAMTAGITEAQLRLLVESVRDYAIFLIDPRGIVISWNLGAQRIKGYRAEEIIGKHFSIFYDEADRLAGKPERELEVASKEGRYEEEGWRARKDGSLFWASVVLTRLQDDTGAILGFAKVTRDLTGRRQAEEDRRRLAEEEARRQAAEESRSRLARVQEELRRALAGREEALRRLEAERGRLYEILRQMPVGVAIVAARDRRYVFANEYAVNLLGANPVGRDLGTSPDYEILDGQGRVLSQEELPVARAVDRGTPVFGQELMIRNPAGGTRTVSLYAAPIRSASGEIESGIATFQDVTALRQAREAAERQARFREQFMAILGHDLRTPVAAVKASAQLLLRREVEPSVARAVARISQSADRMERMIADLLDLTRSRLGGGIPVHPAPAELGAICNQVVEELRVAHPDRHISFRATGQTWGTWDADRIAQVATNLLGNAIAYGARDEEVSISITHDPRPCWVRLEIHNGGSPIPEELKTMIFDPFRRGSTSDRSRGLGLGLFISHEIVRAHGGHMEVESEEGLGTTFTVHLPRRSTGTRDVP